MEQKYVMAAIDAAMFFARFQDNEVIALSLISLAKS